MSPSYYSNACVATTFENCKARSSNATYFTNLSMTVVNDDCEISGRESGKRVCSSQNDDAFFVVNVLLGSRVSTVVNLNSRVITNGVKNARYVEKIIECIAEEPLIHRSPTFHQTFGMPQVHCPGTP